MNVATLRMPRLGETMEQGTVAAWLVSVGERFARGTPLIEFETDKTAVELPALGAGRLSSQLVAPGDVVKLGEPVAEIDLDGEPDWVSATDAVSTSLDHSETDKEHKSEKVVSSAATGNQVKQSVADLDRRRDATTESSSTRQQLVDRLVRATPPARQAAKHAGLEIEHVSGTGRRGRVELSDVEAFLADQDSMHLASTRWGPADGTRVVLVHGFAGDRATFDQLGRGLGRSGMAVRAVDLPGHGETRAEAPTFDHLVDGLASELAIAGPANVVAHSLGAAAAVKAASQCQVASLTLIAPAGLGRTIDGDFIGGMASPASIGEIAHLLRRLSNRVDRLSEQAVSDIYTMLCRRRLVRLAATVARGDNQLISVVKPLAKLSRQVPVRIVVGHRDRIIDWRDTLSVSPNIGIYHFPDAGHMPHWDFPVEVGELLERVILRELNQVSA